MNQHKVSIIIPAYNAEATLNRCIDSVLSQNYLNIEIIIVDDGSTDNTFDIAKNYSSNVSFYSQSNKGACAARNLGVMKCTGYYVKFLDSDDFLSPESISKQVLFASTLKENYISYGYRNVLLEGFESEYKERIPLKNQVKELINSNITITLPLHKKEALVSIGLFDEELDFRQEWDLHLRLASKGYIFVYNEVCVFTQVMFDSSTRISSRALDVNKEVENLNHVRSKFDAYNDQEHKIAWSHKYWTLGRQFLKSNRRKEAKRIFSIAKKISPEKHLALQPRSYKLAVFVFGPIISERLISLHRLLSK